VQREIEPEQQEVEQRLQWFIHDRFGLFIHWGIYAVAGRHGSDNDLAEWLKSSDKLTDEEYRRYFVHFEPDLYDPLAWAHMARQAGMRYAVITTKHHDGFCLWDSQLTEYKATNTPVGRDLIRPWVEAFRAEGLKIGFYHSLLDWHHPAFPPDGFHPQRDDLQARPRAQTRNTQEYVDYLHGQIRELLTNYGTIDILWLDFSYSSFDWGWSKGKGKDDWQSQRLVQMARELQPTILFNNRADFAADFYTPEQVQPLERVQVDGKHVPWEACHTLNGSWGYDRDNHDWKSPDLLVRMLIDAVSKGGNLLLNVGPTARGEFDPNAQSTLHSIGEWMHLHSRSIYGATQSEYLAPADCRFTQRGNRLYLHIFSWPMRHIHVPGLAGRVAYAQLLNDGSEIRMQEQAKDGERLQKNADVLTLEMPIQRPDVLVPVIELFLQESRGVKQVSTEQ
jgi:alpha-L-fucosidase